MEHYTLLKIAHFAGMSALNECTPTPMVVQEHTNMADDTSPVKKEWHVPGGMCGFAWINIKPGNCSFAKYIKKHHGGYKDYYGGISYSVHEGGQSMELKLAYARAFAEVLRANGIERAQANSRLD